MPAKTTPTTDFTGRQVAHLTKEAAEEKARRADEISMVHQIETEAAEHEIIDVTGEPAAPVVVDEVTVVASPDSDKVQVRVAEDLEQVTIGAKTYDFVAGRKYLVEPNVEFVLRTGGKLYDRI